MNCRHLFLFTALATLLWAQQASPVVPAPNTAEPKLTPEEIVAERRKFAKEVLAQIAGREKEPAGKVFKNMKTHLKNTPAETVITIMSIGYSRALGVSCTHCHVPGEWDKDDKPQKQVAREMGAMMKRLNSETFPAIKDLRSEKPGINCTTCHQGELKPAFDLIRAAK